MLYANDIKGHSNPYVAYILRQVQPAARISAPVFRKSVRLSFFTILCFSSQSEGEANPWRTHTEGTAKGKCTAKWQKSYT
ncbi:hypothetical protein GCM10011379_46300 [Filimonas zeae]|uniref:Uncharacterized protein n=1 Tax=Filimonas zeae TaxID=1737353 RepID=A0A917J2G5_9BACT|nr:hypothetical protein GCM10011379_46300 [Filimonas zeae]